jgi:3-phosphoshikimate 1-carboxyvinyltransferase
MREMSDLTLQPVTKPFSATLSPPGSKSLTNRALVLAALADGPCELTNVLFADDTRAMLDGLAKLGFSLEIDEANATVRVHGLGGKIPSSSAELYCKNSGTTIRFLTALCTLGSGDYQLDGNERMRQRPIEPLIKMLRHLGGRASYLQTDGYPPVKVHADRLPGGMMSYGSEVSSQYLSAILQVAPYARHEVRVDLVGQQTSWPYVAMTMQLMDHFGCTPELIRDPDTHEPRQIIIPREPYRAAHYAIEPDASNATYFLAAAAIRPGAKVTIEGLGKRSLQGDVGFADVLHQMGADLVFGKDFITVTGNDKLVGIDVDLLAMPDTAQTLAVVALFAKGPTTIRGLHSLRVKETDRVAALSNELQKLGAKVEINGDDLVIHPPATISPASIATYDDHRMAMSFAVAGTRVAGVTINDIECTNKTYPNFFQDLEILRSS